MLTGVIWGFSVCGVFPNGCPIAFNIERVPNQAGKPAVPLRQAWREGSRIKKKIVANLSMLPDHVVEGFRSVTGHFGTLPGVGADL